MRFRILCSLFLFFISSHSFAQSSEGQPIELDFRLANFTNLPHEIIVMIPDTVSQMLVLPSRGNYYDRQFFYVSYFGDRSKNYFSEPSDLLSIHSLFNSLGSKWLLSITQNLNYSEKETKQYRSFNSLESNMTQYQSVQIKLSNVDSKLFDNSSFSLVFAYEEYRLNEERREQYLSYSTGSYYNLTKSRAYNQKLNKYLFGIDYNISNNKFDLACKLYYQSLQSDPKSLNEYSKLGTTLLSYGTPTILSHPDSISVTSRRSHFSPDLIGLNFRLNFKTNFIFDNEQLSISLNPYFAQGRISGEFSKYERLNTGVDSTSYLIENNKELSSTGIYKNISASIGYSFLSEIEDIDIIGGMILSLNFTSQAFPGINPYEPYLQTSYITKNIAGLQLPIIVYYQPAEFISVYGGLIYDYIFSKTFSNYKFESGSWDNENYDIDYNERMGLNSNVSFNTGMDLEYKNKIKIHLYFISNLANYKNWNVSLGYYF